MNNLFNKNTIGSIAEQEERSISRLSFRDEKASPSMHRAKTIGVLGISSGAGASSLSYALAETLGENVVMLDISCPHKPHRPRDFDVLGLDKRFERTGFSSIYKALGEGTSLKNIENLYNHVNWQIRTPKEDYVLSLADVYRVKSAYSKGLVVCDIQTDFFSTQMDSHMDDPKSILGLLFDFDLIVCVVDPLPSHLIAGSRVLELVRYFEQKGGCVAYIVNKNNDGVNRKELIKYMRTKNFLTLPSLCASDIYEASYNCKTLMGAFAKNKIAKAGFSRLVECCHL